jgi:hypothetical protein
MHMVRALATEDPDVNILACNVTENDTGDDNLLVLLAKMSETRLL